VPNIIVSDGSVRDERMLVRRKKEGVTVHENMERLRRLFATPALSVSAAAPIGVATYLQLTVHDPRHVFLIGLALWGALSLPIGLLVGHAALSEDR
jgi:hypothetical protein